MQIEKVSSSLCLKPSGNQHLCTNRINYISKSESDSVAFGRGIIHPDTQEAIVSLITRLTKLGRPLSANDNTLGEISASINTRKGSNIWELILSSSKGKGKNKEFNTYYYGEGGNKIAKEARKGDSNRFIDGDKLGEMEHLEWNNSVLQVANVLFRHLPQ